MSLPHLSQADVGDELDMADGLIGGWAIAAPALLKPVLDGLLLEGDACLNQDDWVLHQLACDRTQIGGRWQLSRLVGTCRPA